MVLRKVAFGCVVIITPLFAGCECGKSEENASKGYVGAPANLETVSQNDVVNSSVIFQGMEEKKIEVGGMTVEWSLQSGGRFICTVSAPTRGWVAVGFNTRDDIVGANLIMASVQNDIFRINEWCG